MQIQHILVATDLNEGSQSTLKEYAVDGDPLSRAPAPAASCRTRPAALGCGGRRPESKRSLPAIGSDADRTCGASHRDFRSGTRVGHAGRPGRYAAEQILAYATEHHINLIVLGRHGHGPVARALREEHGRSRRPQGDLSGRDGAGGRAWRRAEAGTGDDRTRGDVMSTIRTILVPIDFGDASHAALAYACHLATTVGARLHVLHVCEPPWTHRLAYLPPPAGSVETLSRAAEAASDARLETVRVPIGAESLICIGEPRAGVLRYVNEHLADLIVMGTHGWHGVERYCLRTGSRVTSCTTPGAPCSPCAPTWGARVQTTRTPASSSHTNRDRRSASGDGVGAGREPRGHRPHDR